MCPTFWLLFVCMFRITYMHMDTKGGTVHIELEASRESWTPEYSAHRNRSDRKCVAAPTV